VKFLVVRRDNIGDLVLTTPVFAALKARFPGCRVEALANTYNAPILEGHPDLDAVHAYKKDKHLDPGESRLANWTARLAQYAKLRRARFDTVIVASPGWRPRDVQLARGLSPGRVVAFVPPGETPAGVDVAVTYEGSGGCHHVEDVFRILGPLGIEGPPSAPRLGFPVPPREAGRGPVIAFQVSARKPSQRWAEARFVEAMRAIHADTGSQARLFWSPGAENDPRHPGDDDKAARLMAAAAGLPVKAVRTTTLQDLAKGLAACDAFVGADGGAMHVAAALGKPVVALFGDSDAVLWRPWGVPHRVLQPASRDVADVSVAEVRAAFGELARESGLAGR
jgi:ADP-heptose:LPS heptosyltransferase